jgi:hypothetical protein
MTGTSRALSRLGVAGLGAVMMFAGLVPFTATVANAAIASSVSLSPGDTAAVGECNAFTATVTPTGTSITVNIQEAVPSSTAIAGEAIGFCDPVTPPNTDTEGAVTAGPGTPGANTTAGGTAASPADAAHSCHNTAATDSTHTSNVSCNTTYTDANGDGKIVFGVASTTPGSMSVNAFGDNNSNGAQDVGEPGATSTKTWVANNPNASTDKISCTPTTATNPAGTTHTFTCTVTDANGVALAGATNVKFVITSGPDASAVPQNCTTTANGTGGTTTGQSTCQYLNNGTPGHDVITAYLEQNAIVGQQAGEPSTTITKDWVAAAPSTSQITVTCSTGQISSAANGTSGTDAACQEPLSAKNVTVTAKVTNGSPAQPVSGVVVQFALGPVGFAAQDANDTESITPTSCTTGSDGSCSTTFTDTVPKDGEQFKVTANLSRQGPSTASATATITYHQATDVEARNIAVLPDAASQPSGGAQAFVATVTDEFGNPVSGACVGWSESGPGRFSSSTQGPGCTQEDANGNFVGSWPTSCITAANGQCGTEVTSLSTETGAETITGSLLTNYQDTGGTPPFECQEVAGKSFGATDANAKTAGNCTDTGTVTWKTSTPPPPHGRQAVSVHLTCFSRHAHKVTCVAQLSKAIAGVTVIFRDGHGNKVGSDVTGSGGKARLHLRGLRSGSHHKYQAHAKRSSRTFSADSNFARVTVK